jgi:hypothetical protein
MMDDKDLTSHVAKLVDQCEEYLMEQSKDRERALEYYNGEMSDMKPDEGRSGVVSKDVRAVIKKLMPSIMRAILSNDKIVDYEPVGQEDVESAQQATDYVNHVVVPECGAEQAIYDAVFDALLLKTGVLKWSAYKRLKSTVEEFSNQSDDDVLGLIGDPENEIIDHEKTEETDEAVLELDPNARRHSFKLRRIEEQVDVRLEAVPRGSFLIYPGADSIDDAPIVGERLEMTRSDLVSMGYEKDDVYHIAMHTRPDNDEDEQARKGADWTDIEGETAKAMEAVIVYEVYVKLDQDGDGIAEMYRMVFGESGEDDQSSAKHIVLDMEPVSEAPYADVIAERDAHQFEGHSIFEDMEDIQRIKTFLMRGVIDNIAWQNNPQLAVDLEAVEDPEAIYNPEFGKPILLKSGRDVRQAVQQIQVPFFADSAFQMLPYMDEVAKDRTGITDASGGVDPEAFQQMTATSAQLMSEAGIAQAEMIIRTLTRGGIRKAFRGLLRLVIAHHDQPRTVRLRGEWAEYNPAHWNVGMDCTVNVGLGAGSRERDMSVLQIVLGLQKELIASIGPDNPYVKPDQLYNTLEKMTETAGFPSAEPYFTKPNPEEIQAKMQSQQEQPDPAIQKVQAQMQLEQAKAQAREQVEQAQMQADLQVKDAERTKDLEIAALKAQVDLLKHNQSMELEYAKAGMVAPQTPQVGLPGVLDG